MSCDTLVANEGYCNEIRPVFGHLETPTQSYGGLCSATHSAVRCGARVFVIPLSPSLQPGTVMACITQNLWYSAVHYFWPVQELAELADGPTGCGEAARGGCSFAWKCAYGGGEEY